MFKKIFDKSNMKIKCIVILSIVFVLMALLLVVGFFILDKNNIKDGVKALNQKDIVGDIKKDDQEVEGLKKFSNYGELRDFLEANSGIDYGSRKYRSDEVIFDEVAMEEETGSISNIDKQVSVMGIEGDAMEHSDTNIQVMGVDEADIIKTDGNYIYAVSNKNLFIVDSKDPENLNIISKIEFENQPQDIYLNNDRLVVFGRNDEIQKDEGSFNFKRYSQYTFVKVFDISDRKSPKQLKDYDFEGSYSNSRMIGDYVYFLTNASNISYTDFFPVPRVLDGGKEIYSLDEENCLGSCPDVYYVDDVANQYTMVNVMAINIQDISSEDNNSLNHKVYLMPYNQNLYVSHDNLYLTYTKYLNQQEFLTNLKLEIIWGKLSLSDRNKIDKIRNTEYFILNKNEKIRKIDNILSRVTLSEDESKGIEEMLKNKVRERYTQIVDKIEETIVHKIAIVGSSLKYEGSGVVPGKVLNQFSMDENNDNFRIATTRNQNRLYWLSDFDIDEFSDTQESYNNLYVLNEELEMAGRLEGLAEGERIYSVRFMGDRAYMVTFRQTDPLFVIDLQNPRDPKVLGKLKIPGFSNYLHPYDKNHLIGIGKDTEENDFGGVITKGLKIALFDVSDVENPKEKAKYILGGKGSDSLALRDHKAFLFDREKNLLVLPVTLRNDRGWSNNWSGGVEIKRLPNSDIQNYFVGAAVFDVNENEIDLRDIISHSNNTEDKWCLGNCYDNVILRSLWIKDALYTFSNGFLQANKISDLDLIKKLELKFDGGDDFKVVN